MKDKVARTKVSIGEQAKSEGYPRCVTGLSLMVRPRGHPSHSGLLTSASTFTELVGRSSGSVLHAMQDTHVLIPDRERQFLKFNSIAHRR